MTTLLGGSASNKMPRLTPVLETRKLRWGRTRDRCERRATDCGDLGPSGSALGARYWRSRRASIAYAKLQLVTPRMEGRATHVSFSNA
jgi:hypothetical protein